MANIVTASAALRVRSAQNRAIAIFQLIVGGFAARRCKTRSVLAKTPTTKSKIAIKIAKNISCGNMYKKGA